MNNDEIMKEMNDKAKAEGRYLGEKRVASMRAKRKMRELIKEFEDIIEEAPVDFLGTGSDSKWANKCEREWFQKCEEFKKKLKLLGK